ncbi:hypothetical protein CKO12_05375 [Chromatium okenii]|nr:hypothetical protein [Chromatium okenii]
MLIPSLLCAALPAAIKQPIIAAHYFGQHWPKNFLSAFRRDVVANDFMRLRNDGFNTVIFLVSWGDFQPVIDPCCEWDERALTRLQFLLDEAKKANLQVILRVGYGWSLHPRAGSALQRIHQLLNTDVTKLAFFTFIQRLGQLLKTAPHVTMTLMSWEDQWLHKIDPSARATFAKFNRTLPSERQITTAAPLPTPTGQDAALFHGYWDWLVMTQLYEPAREFLPQLSYEIRVDKDPIAANSLSINWLTHQAMYRQAGTAPVTIYWAPFWGAENRGEQLTATRAHKLLTALLQETRELSGQRDIFIDQLNVIDNTPGYEHNAVINPAELNNFLTQAACSLKQHGVIGYGYWTTQDYRESLLYNPAFSLGLDGWQLHSSNANTALQQLPSGDFELTFTTGAVLTQTISASAGRLPTKADSYPDHICIEVSGNRHGSVTVTAGNAAPATQLYFANDRDSLECDAIVALPSAEQLTLSITANDATALTLRGVWLFDHVQIGGLYDVTGQPSFLYQAFTQLNRTFAATTLPAICSVQK